MTTDYKNVPPNWAIIFVAAGIMVLSWLVYANRAGADPDRICKTVCWIDGYGQRVCETRCQDNE